MTCRHTSGFRWSERQELERKNLTDLAVLCGKVADSRSTDSGTARKARELKQEWALLIAQEPHPVLEEQKKIEAQKESLRKRMVDFLAVVP
jgi:hypothetical protein